MEKLPTGILGGTFDPIHLGHIHLATTIYHLCNLQQVLLIPSYQSPLRTPPIATAKDRLNMVRLATKKLPFLKVDGYEIQHSTLSYTSNTLKYLYKKMGTPLALIMGIDVFNRFNEWYEWQEILNLAHLIVVNRKNYELNISSEVAAILTEKQIFAPQELQKKPSGLIYFVDIKPLPITATEIRALIQQQKDISHLVTKEVWQYINDNKLYTRAC